MSSTDQTPKGVEPKERKLSRKNAEAAAQQFFDYYEIDPEDETDDSKAQLQKAMEKIIKATMRGRLEFNIQKNKNGLDEMIVTQHLKHPLQNGTSAFAYGVMNGRAKVAMKGASDNDTAGKLQMLMGYLSGTSAGIIGDLMGVDYSLVESLGLVFLLL
jgi:hypothetical protein